MGNKEEKTNAMQCHARRHMKPHLFVTYDAMVAMAKSGPEWKPSDALLFYAMETTLANMNNRHVNSESNALKELAALGWIKKLARRGSHGTNRYRVLEHDEFAQEHDCPQLLYDPITGDRFRKGEQPANFIGSQSTVNRRFTVQTPSVHSLGPFGSQSAGDKSVSQPERKPDKQKPETLPEKPTAQATALSDSSLSTDRLNPARMVDQPNPLPELEAMPSTTTEETVGEHFGEISIHAISDEELERDEVYPHWGLLEECCRVVVQAKATLPFRGRKSCGDLMGEAMARLKAEHHLQAPRPWLPVMKKLREGGPVQVQIAKAIVEVEDTRICECLQMAAKGARVDISAYAEEIQAYQKEIGEPDGWRTAEPFTAALIAKHDYAMPELETLHAWLATEIERMLGSQSAVNR